VLSLGTDSANIAAVRVACYFSAKRLNRNCPNCRIAPFLAVPIEQFPITYHFCISTRYLPDKNGSENRVANLAFCVFFKSQ